MKTDFETALQVFVETLQKNIDDFTQANHPNLIPDKIELQYGKTMVKVVRQGPSGGRSVHCFIARTDNTTKTLGTVKAGDVLKAASWKTPAKHVRGTILSCNFDDYGVGVFGAHYR
jgi:hypothetical protein